MNVNYSKPHNRLYQIYCKTYHFAQILKELSIRYENKALRPGLKKITELQLRTLEKLKIALRQNEYDFISAPCLLRPPALKYVDEEQVHDVTCTDEISTIIYDAKELQTEHFDQVIRSNGLPTRLKNILREHLVTIHNTDFLVQSNNKLQSV